MCNCRRKKYHSLYNNMCNNDKNMYETIYNDTLSDNYSNYNMNLSCGFDDDVENNVFPVNPMYGQSYVPFQTIDETFMPNSGLDKGTLFPELVSNYCPGQSMAEIQYLMNSNGIKEGINR